MSANKEIKVMNGEQLLAIIIPASSRFPAGITFLTEKSTSFQAGLLEHPAGHIILPHVHNVQIRTISDSAEFLFLRSGRVRVDFYDDGRNFIGDYLLETGDCILLLAGGHGFECLEPADILEVKQGPYAGEQNDKTRFVPNGK